MSGTVRQHGQSQRIGIVKEDWEARLAEVPILRDDMNRLVMDYLVIEGYRDAAENFARESGLQPTVDIDSIEYRMHIRHAIQRGDVEEAISRVNDLNPEILDSNPSLFFSLQQQRMIEYIRQGQIAEALDFAQQELAPRGEENPEFLAELERTMALLAFDTSLNATTTTPLATTPTTPTTNHLEMIPRHVHELLHPAQRIRTASELNSAILTSQSHGKDPKLMELLRLMLFGEKLLEERADFPKLDLTELMNRDRNLTCSQTHVSSSGSGGDEAMVVAL